MRSENTRLLVMTLVLLGLVSGPDTATDRKWMKSHKQIVEVQTGAVRAEYTLITTADRVSPNMSRILYQDDQGVRLIVRGSAVLTNTDRELPTALSGEHSVTMLGTGEVLSLSYANNQVTITVGKGSFSFNDDGNPSASLMTTAQQTMRAHASQTFRDALARYAAVGTSTGVDNLTLPSTLCELFFPSLVVENPQYRAGMASEAVVPFDPSATPPGAFEQAFGQAYH